MPVSGGVTGQQKDGEGRRVCPFKPGKVSGKRLPNRIPKAPAIALISWCPDGKENALQPWMPQMH